MEQSARSIWHVELDVSYGTQKNKNSLRPQQHGTLGIRTLKFAVTKLLLKKSQPVIHHPCAKCALLSSSTTSTNSLQFCQNHLKAKTNHFIWHRKWNVDASILPVNWRGSVCYSLKHSERVQNVSQLNGCFYLTFDFLIDNHRSRLKSEKLAVAFAISRLLLVPTDSTLSQSDPTSNGRISLPHLF